MLIVNQTRGQHSARTKTADNPRQFNCVNGAKFQLSITIELDEFNRCAQQSSGFFCLSYSLSGCAMSSSLTARTNDKMHFAPGTRFAGDDAAAPKFNIVGVCAKGQQGSKFR